MTSEFFQKNIAATIPHQPGIYKYFDEEKTLIYVGKAKNLRKRIGSYFNKTFVGYKTHELVQRIAGIEFTIVDSEQDAFLLENALIKQFQPKYNITLKDDKTYPYIVIKHEPFARIFFTRRKLNDGSEYLGPFTSVGKVRELIGFIKQFVPLRTCKLNLTQKNIQQKKFKLCLEYHLGNCKAPCEGLQTQDDYNNGILQIKNILKGNVSVVMQAFKTEMQQLSTQLKFEKAEIIKQKIEHLKNFQSKSVIVNAHLGNLDVFSILKNNNIAFVNYLMVQNGTIVQTHTVQLETKLEETEKDVLSFAVNDLRNTFNSLANEIIVPFEIDYPQNGTALTVPKAGDKKKLLDLSLKNVNYYREEIEKKKTLHLEEKKSTDKIAVLKKLQAALHLNQLPLHIECFDNSNFQGSFPVSAMVCFKNGEPSKKDYRHFNVKTVKGINDFATMKEVVQRRYSRLLRENAQLPQLIIIDGGKGQLSAAMESITQLDLKNKITVVGLAKNEEEIFFPGDSQSFKLKWDSEELNLVRYIRDEVHRFGITFHRNKRSLGTFKNELQQINGIGEQTANLLLKNFKSVANIQQQPFEKLAEVTGKKKAEIIIAHFKK